jgi:hypothetical protein
VKAVLSKIIVILLICLILTVVEPAGSIMGQSKSDKPLRILIDASKDGGLWWFPQVHPFDAEQYHQGKAFADGADEDR